MMKLIIQLSWAAAGGSRAFHSQMTFTNFPFQHTAGSTA
jgi:hypothetical protein